jgi:hypothetical protein
LWFFYEQKEEEESVEKTREVRKIRGDEETEDESSETEKWSRVVSKVAKDHISKFDIIHIYNVPN